MYSGWYLGYAGCYWATDVLRGSNIFDLDCLPLSIFNAVGFKPSLAIPAIELTRLELLDLGINVKHEYGKGFNPTSSTFPNLRLLLIGNNGAAALELIQRIIFSSANSIERVHWMFSESGGIVVLLTHLFKYSLLNCTSTIH